MALASTIEIIESMRATGLLVSIVPGDRTFDIELHRQRDDGTGHPDGATETLVVRLPPAGNTAGVFYADPQPADGVKRFYRYRHVRAGWDAGKYSPWSAGVAPYPIDAGSTTWRPWGGQLIPSFGDGATRRESAGISAVSDLVNTGRYDLVMNGDFESDAAYWAEISSGIASLETASPLRGSRSLRVKGSAFVNVDPGDVYQFASGRAGSFDRGESLNVLYTRLQPGEVLELRAIGRLTGSSSALLRVRGYGNTGDATSIELGSVSFTSTSTTEQSVKFTVPADGSVTYATIGIQRPGSGVDLIIDGIHLFRRSIAEGVVSFEKFTAALQHGLSVGDRLNGLFNPGFEDGLAHWVNASGVGTVSAPTSAANAKSGNRYLEVSHTGVVDVYAALEEVGATLRYFEVVPGDTYDFSCYAMVVSGPGSALLNLQSFDKDKGSGSAHQVSTTAGSWTKLSGSFVAGSTDKYVALKLGLSAASATVVRFDDVRFSRRPTEGLGNVLELNSQRVTGVTSTTPLTYTVPAGQLAIVGDALRIQAKIHKLATTASLLLQLQFGATTVLSQSVPTTPDDFTLTAIVRRTGGSAEMGYTELMTYSSPTWAATRSNPAENTAAAIMITLTSSTTEGFDVDHFTVEYLPKV